jgi:DNA-3-methyladenine glycosylase II
VLRLPEGLALIEVRDQGAPKSPALSVTVLAGLYPEDLAGFYALVAWVLHTDHDTARFWTWARGRPDLWQGLSPVEGLPMPRTETMYEALINTVIEQQIAWTAAQRAQRLLCEWGGEYVEYEASRYYALPAPARLAAADPADLKMLKITDRRSALLIRIASEVAAGQLDLEGLRHLSIAERYARLTAIKGVGHWTAVMATSGHTARTRIPPRTMSRSVPPSAAICPNMPEPLTRSLPRSMTAGNSPGLPRCFYFRAM